MKGGELTSTVSITPYFSRSSLVLFDGVECLLGPSVNLLAEGTGRGALLEPPALDAIGFFGLFFLLVGLNDGTIVLGHV